MNVVSTYSMLFVIYFKFVSFGIILCSVSVCNQKDSFYLFGAIIEIIAQITTKKKAQKKKY